MPSIVYFTRVKEKEPSDSIQKKVKQLWEEAGFNQLINKDDFVAIKLHMGEEGGKGYIKPHFVRPIVDNIKEQKGKPFLTDSSTLYVGRRTNAVDHINLAYEHGFTFENVGCPVIIADGLRGEHHLSIKVNNPLLKNIHMSGIVGVADTIIGLAHPTGHMVTGYGGALKNIGMGLASRGGKLAQHSGVQPQVNLDKCIGCEVCSTWCPAEAISIKGDKMKIDFSKCMGCGECLSVCSEHAIKIAWDESSVNLQRKIVEYVTEILKGKNKGFMNFATHITKQCDCMGGKAGDPVVSDFGILASLDPVALDQATIDLINQNEKRDIFKDIWKDFDYNIQLAYGETLKLGSRTYQLKEIL